jgi:hypothetical protein
MACIPETKRPDEDEVWFYAPAPRKPVPLVDEESPTDGNGHDVDVSSELWIEERCALDVKNQEPTGPSASQRVLAVAGVEICKSGENLPREEIRRRFDLAEEAMWTKLHEKGYDLPPES